MLAITKFMLDAYKNNEMRPLIIYGPYGYGKSVYTMKALSECYSHKGKVNWDITMFREYLRFHPKDVINYWLSRKSRGIAFNWDDAGYWLYALDWSNPLMKSISKYLTNIARTDWGGIMLTTPNPMWIMKKVRAMSNVITVRISKVFSDNDKKNMKLPDGTRVPRKWIRLANGYEGWMSPDFKATGVHHVFQDVFILRLPDPVYEWYCPVREKYSMMAKQAMKDRLKFLNADIDVKLKIRGRRIE